jgi:hypothetical protein
MRLLASAVRKEFLGSRERLQGPDRRMIEIRFNV